MKHKINGNSIHKERTWGAPPGGRGGVRSTLLQVLHGFLFDVHDDELVKNHDFLTISENAKMYPGEPRNTPVYL